MADKSREDILGAQVEDFTALVREYVLLVDRAAETPLNVFVSRCSILLPRLYVGAQLLPRVEPPDGVESHEFAGDVRGAFPTPQIATLLGKLDLYKEVFDPLDDEEIVLSRLSNDLGEIYWDLKSPLVDFDSGDPVRRVLAVWDWRFEFQSHTGRHIVDALRPIFWLVFDYIGLPEADRG